MPAQDQVAAVDQRVLGDLGHGRAAPPGRSWRSARPPCRPTSRRAGARASPPRRCAGCRSGAKQMNQGWVNSRFAPTSAVPVLPATCDALERAPRYRCPPRRRGSSSRSAAAAVSGFITSDCKSGSMRSFTRPSLATIRSVRRGFISRPLLAIAAATSAICSGVTWISPSSAALADRHAPDVEAVVHVSAVAADAARDHLGVRVVELRVLVEAVALHVLDERRRGRPSRPPERTRC